MSPADGLRPPAFRLEVHPVLGSTSDEVIARAGRGEPAGLAVLALRQTGARGSRGRDWREPAGNLALSVLLRPGPGEGGGTGGRYALAGAVALHDALSGGLDRPDALSIKWPNDLLLDGGKVAGILVETGVAAGGGLDWVSIGFGANLLGAPAIEGRRTACVAAFGTPPAPATLARLVLDRLAAALVADAASLRARWLARAHPTGTAMRVATASGERVGSFAGLAEDGALLLRSGERVVAIGSGTVRLADRGADRGSDVDAGRDVPCFS